MASNEALHDYRDALVEVTPLLGDRAIDLTDATIDHVDGAHQPSIKELAAALAEVNEKVGAFEALNPKTALPEELRRAQIAAEDALHTANYEQDIALVRHGYAVGRREGVRLAVGILVKHWRPGGGDVGELMKLLGALTDPQACEALLLSLDPDTKEG